MYHYYILMTNHIRQQLIFLSKDNVSNNCFIFTIKYKSEKISMKIEKGLSKIH